MYDISHLRVKEINLLFPLYLAGSPHVRTSRAIVTYFYVNQILLQAKWRIKDLCLRGLCVINPKVVSSPIDSSIYTAPELKYFRNEYYRPILVLTNCNHLITCPLLWMIFYQRILHTLDVKDSPLPNIFFYAIESHLTDDKRKMGRNTSLRIKPNESYFLKLCYSEHTINLGVVFNSIVKGLFLSVPQTQRYVLH